MSRGSPFYDFHDSAWAVPRHELPQYIQQKIDTENCLVSILWSVSGIHSLLDVPKGQDTTQRSSLMVLCPV
jgi:hypothetical protein